MRSSGKGEELKKYLGHAAKYRCHDQERAMTLAFQAYQPEITSPYLLFVFPTGHGKKLFWLLPSLKETRCAREEDRSSRITILIVPTVALLEDSTSKAIRSGLNVCKNSTDCYSHDVDVVIFEATAITSKAYRTFLLRT